VLLCCLFAGACETEPFQLGFKDPASHITMSMTGVGLSWPVVGVGIVLTYLVGRLGRKRREDK